MFASQCGILLTFVPCCLSNFNHQAQVSPRSLLVAIARWNHCRAFSILPSAQNKRATVHIITGSSDDFLSASTDLALRVARGSSHIASDQRRPELGHSWRPVMPISIRLIVFEIHTHREQEQPWPGPPPYFVPQRPQIRPIVCLPWDSPNVPSLTVTGL